MIAQLSPRYPRGSPSASSIGVRWAGYFSRYSGAVVLPHTSSSSKSSPAARTKIRAVRLFTLGLRTFSVFADMRFSSLAVGLLGRAVLRERRVRALGEQLDRIGEVHAVDVVVATLDAQQVGLHQHVGVGVPVWRHEAVGGELDQQAE